MYVDSIYNKMIQSEEKRKNMGYDYAKEGLISKFVSPRMFMNPRMEGFLNEIDPAMIEFNESVKKIQFYTNFTIDKNDRRLNV